MTPRRLTASRLTASRDDVTPKPDPIMDGAQVRPEVRGWFERVADGLLILCAVLFAVVIVAGTLHWRQSHAPAPVEMGR